MLQAHAMPFVQIRYLGFRIVEKLQKKSACWNNIKFNSYECNFRGQTLVPRFFPLKK